MNYKTFMILKTPDYLHTHIPKTFMYLENITF